MAKDLRQWIENLSTKAPGEIIQVDQPIQPDRFEAAALLTQMEKRGRYEAVLFEKNKDLQGKVSEFRVLMNTFATVRKIGMAFDLPAIPRVEVLKHILNQLKREIKPIVVSPQESPVKENIWRGGDLDLRRLPIVRHMDLDGGPYLTPVAATRDLKRGRYNISWNRMMYLDETHLCLYMSPRHLWSYVAESEREGKNLPLAVILGHHPAFHISAAALCPLEKDEYELASGFLGEPLRIVPSEVYGEELMVPADAELIIEGEVIANKRTVEGPFGEFTGYCGPQRLSWLFEAKAITYRTDAMLIDIFTCHPDHINVHIAIEASLYGRIKETVPSVKEVCWLDSGAPRDMIISMAKRMEGEPMRAAMVALSAGNHLKHVIVVDDDICPSNLKEVMWAVSTRVQADQNVHIITGIQGSVLDPSLREEIRGAAMVIDATKPLDRPFPRRGKVPEEILQKVLLDQYIKPR